MMNKEIVRERFTKAADTYDQNAVVQQSIANKTIQLMQQHIKERLNHLFEFGCGTGYFSRLVSKTYQPESLLLNDLCDHTQSSLSDLLTDTCRFIQGDAEQMVLKHTVDAILSCSTIQWFNKPFDFLNRMADHLNDQGYVVCTSFGPQNFREIKEITGKGLHYPTLNEFQQALINRYEIIHSEEEVIKVTFNSPMAVLYHLKDTGVNCVSTKPFTKADLNHFKKAYEQYIENGCYPLTYHPMYFILKKKNK